MTNIKVNGGIFILEAKNVTYKYPDGTVALDHINFKVEKGEMVSLLGKNGAGKSTLFLHFNGIYEPTEGEILIEGEKIDYTKKGLMKVRQKVGIVFQNPDDQLFAPTVEEDVAFGPLNLGYSQEETQEIVTESLKRVGMSGYERKAPHHLSGGQKLDPRGASDILKLLYELNEEGMTIIISTHDVDLVPVYSNKVFVISKGGILESGTPKEVFADVDLIRKANLRLPRIAHLAEILEKHDDVDFNGEYPLTIGQARKSFNKKIKCKNE